LVTIRELGLMMAGQGFESASGGEHAS
jgi:hypothetical protein